MSFSLELAFDPESEIRIKVAWVKSSEFYNTNYMITHGVVPHIALVVMDRPFRGSLTTIRPTSISLGIGPVNFFNNGNIVFFTVPVCQTLKNIQKIAFDAVIAEGGIVDPYYTPKDWIPHCSLAQECTKNIGIPMAHVTFTATVTRLIQVSYPPTSIIDQLNLTADP